MSRYGAAPIPIPTPASGFYDVASPALPLGYSEALVICNRVLVQDDPEGFNSVTNPLNWTITPINPEIVKEDGSVQIPAGEVVPRVANPQIALVTVDDEYTNQYHVFTVTPMENRVRYTFELSNAVRSLDCDELADNIADYRAVTRGLPPQPRWVQQDELRDFAMTYFPVDPLQPPSTWRFDSTGDIGIQNNLQSLQKRLYRRLSTKPGGFRHLGTGYGVNLKLKTLFRAGRAQELANDMARQCRLEPEVLDAGVSVKLKFAGSSPYLDVSIRVLTTQRRTGKFTFAVALGD